MWRRITAVVTKMLLPVSTSSPTPTRTLGLEELEQRTLPSFVAGSPISVGSQPNADLLVDLTHDGHLDLVAVNTNTSTISVSMGNGDGTFTAARTFAAGNTPVALAAGDFNGDGNMDLVVANALTNSISFLAGNGDGSFAAPVSFTVGSLPHAIAVADFNDDGKLDLAVTDSGSNIISVMLGNGNGTFTSPQNFLAGDNPTGIAVGDFLNHGKPDLAVTDSADNTVSILVNSSGINATGVAFSSPITFSVGKGPDAVAATDLTGDGRTDLVVANAGDNTISVLTNTTTLGTGTPTFNVPGTYTVGKTPTALAVGDFLGNGSIDIAVANSLGNTVSVLMGNGDGSFQAPVNFATGAGPIGLTQGSVSGNGEIDLATANVNDGTVTIFRNNLPPQATGAFSSAATVSTRNPNPTGIAAGLFNLNSDGHTDLVVADKGDDSATLLLGNGDGSFGSPYTTGTDNQPEAVAVGDFNRDGREDAVVTDSNSMSVSLLLGSGTGTFAATLNYEVGHNPSAIVTGDFNVDGRADLAVTNQGDNTVGILEGADTGGFPVYTTFSVGSAPDAIATGDFNSDGKSDLVIANSGSNNLTILTNITGPVATGLTSANPGFFAFSTVAVGTDPTGVAVGDFNGDGKADIAVTNGKDNTVSILLGTGNGGFAAPVNYAVGSDPSSIIATDLTGSGVTDLVVTNKNSNSISVLLGTGNGTFQPAVNYSVGSAPTSVVEGNFLGNGLPDLAVVNSGSNNISILTGIANDATHLHLTLPTMGSIIAGTPFPVTVTALTASNQPDGRYNGTVGFSVQGSTGTIPSTAFNFQDGGSATVQATLPAGIQTITASDTTNPALQTQAVVNPGGVTTSISLTPSATNVNAGQTVTLTAAVVASSTAQGAPTGSVTFFDGNSALATVALDSSGRATTSPLPLSVGNHALVAVYNPPAAFAAATSSAVSVTVQPETTSVTLSPSALRVVAGRPVTLTAAVTAGNALAGPPTGSITFFDGTSALATVALDATGRASTSPTLSAGPHALTAEYTPGSSFTGSASSAATVNVVSSLPSGGAVATFVALTPSADAAIANQTVILNATVTAALGTNGAATGTVTFLDGSTSLAVVNLDGNGNASTGPITFTAGTHALSAVYTPNSSSFTGSTSATVDVPVSASSTLPPVAATVGTFDPTTATWYLRNENGSGAPDAGSFSYGAPGWIPVMGDWDGNGTQTIGVFDPSTATWYLRNENSAGAPDAGVFQFGQPGDIPVVGDWNGTGRTGIGVYDPTTGVWTLRNEASAGPADAGTFQYGAPGWVPLTGDWNNSGHTGIGVFDSATATFYLRNEANAGAPDAGAIAYGVPGWTPVVGDWNGDGSTTIGVVDPTTGTWYLRNENSPGVPDAGVFAYGLGGWTPVTGAWNATGISLPAGTDPNAVAPLTQDQLNNAVQAALQQFSQAGVNSTTMGQLSSAIYAVGALPGDTLGRVNVAADQVVLSTTAAGVGWYTNSSAQSNAAFTTGAPGTTLTALLSGPAAGQEDLLSAVEAEMAQIANQNNQAPDLTTTVLPPGVRRLQTLS
jgi:hypothetical protein